MTDVKNEKRSLILVAPGEGRTLPRPDTGGTVTIKLSSETTDGTITVWESEGPAGETGGRQLHSHPGFAEIFYVLAGEYEFTAGKENYTASAGTLVFVARGIFHSFARRGPADGRLLALAIPGGVEDFFDEMRSNEMRRAPRSVLEARARQTGEYDH